MIQENFLKTGGVWNGLSMSNEKLLRKARLWVKLHGIPFRQCSTFCHKCSGNNLEGCRMRENRIVTDEKMEKFYVGMTYGGPYLRCIEWARDI